MLRCGSNAEDSPGYKPHDHDFLEEGLIAVTMDRRKRTLQSLAGLSVGDSFGECFFSASTGMIADRQLPPGPWIWTDDTHMALSIVEVLFSYNTIEQDELARLFAHRFVQEPWRGYAGGAQRLLNLYAQGADWRDEAPRLFDGGSYGNGGAMRAAPIGAFFAGEPERAATEARRSAQVTHAHLEGQVGAMAVAVATAMMTLPERPTGNAFLREVLAYLPRTKTSEGIEAATGIGPDEYRRARSDLGTGRRVAAFDTVPYCLWVVAHHSNDFEIALWITVEGMGDQDTTCAIVGGVVALINEIPPEWFRRRERLPEGYDL